MKTIELLTKQGFHKIDEQKGYVIYGKGFERAMYVPTIDQVGSYYKDPEAFITKEALRGINKMENKN